MSAVADAIVSVNLARASESLGPILLVSPDEFLRVLAQQDVPLVAVCETSGWLAGTSYRYLTGYKGLIFYAKSRAACVIMSRTRTTAGS